jgi:hypothetical protein
VVEDQHIEVDGHVLGLILDGGDIHSNQMSIYIELGPRRARVRPRPVIAAAASQRNVARHAGLKGRFGVHPGAGQATCCLQGGRPRGGRRRVLSQLRRVVPTPIRRYECVELAQVIA